MEILALKQNKQLKITNKQNGLVIDGIVGPKTWAKITSQKSTNSGSNLLMDTR